MSHSAGTPPPPDAEPIQLDAAAALDEIRRVARRVRVRLWREVFQWIAIAVLFPTCLLMQHLHPRQSKWIVLAALTLIMLAIYLQVRAGVVGRDGSRRSKLVSLSFVLLYAAAGAAMDWVPPGLSTWAVVVALAPGLPPLLGAAWVLRR
jgi:hypothetical protein